MKATQPDHLVKEGRFLTISSLSAKESALWRLFDAELRTNPAKRRAVRSETGADPMRVVLVGQKSNETQLGLTDRWAEKSSAESVQLSSRRTSISQWVYSL